MSFNNGTRAADQIISIVQKKSKATCEVYFTEKVTRGIKVHQGKVETLTEARSLGLGLRVVDQGRIGFAYTSDFSSNNLELLAEKVLQLAQAASADEFNVLPKPQSAYPEISTWDEKINAVPLSEKIDMTMVMEETALGYDPRIKAAEHTMYSDESRHLTIVNSEGLQGQYRANYCLLHVAPLARDGEDAQTSGEYIITGKFDELAPRAIAGTAAAKALRLLGGRGMKTGSYPVIFSQKVAAEFLSEIASAVNAEAVLKGRSLFVNKLGKKVAATDIVIVDDGLLPGGIASAPFDDEGVAMQATEVINNGVLSSYLHNSYSAARMKEKSTGNAVRSGYRGLPYIGASNFYLKPGSASEEELIKSLDKGLYVERIMNVGGVNPVNGDYSVGVVGHYIENGEFRHPVQQIVIAGNINSMLTTIAGIADNLRFIPTHGGVCGAPAILFEEMTIGGR